MRLVSASSSVVTNAPLWSGMSMTVAVHAPGQEVHENTLFLLLTFAVNLKTTIKNKSINHLLSPNENKIKILSDKQREICCLQTGFTKNTEGSSSGCKQINQDSHTKTQRGLVKII